MVLNQYLNFPKVLFVALMGKSWRDFVHFLGFLTRSGEQKGEKGGLISGFVSKNKIEDREKIKHWEFKGV